MNGCRTCGGYGMHHDPVAHGTAGEPEDRWELQADGWPTRECDHDGGECHDVEHQQ